MVQEYKYTKLVDAGKLHKALAEAGYAVLGISYDSGRNEVTVMLDDSETKDPEPVVTAYVYVTPVFYDYTELFLEAQDVVAGALTQYNTAKDTYISALQAWNSAGSTITTSNALVKLGACERMVESCANALEASKDAIAALVQVVTVLARNNSLVEEEG